MGVLSRIKGVLSRVESRGGWWPVIREAFAGAWQKNIEWNAEDVSAFHAVYACIKLISSDISKLPLRVVQEKEDGTKAPIHYNDKAPRSVLSVRKLLKKPNTYQNTIQFVQWWITSKLFRGNVYALKHYNSSGVLDRLYILNPDLVEVLVSPDGSVFYQLNTDNLSGIEDATITVPASEIIHDRMCCLFHPLIGISPLYAGGLAAHQGLTIQKDSTLFFANGSRPSGILSAPGAISQETADRLKAHWESNYSGKNSGKVAVLGDNLKFEQMRTNAADSQTIQLLEWSAQVVCSVFSVPAYKIMMGKVPSTGSTEPLTIEYFQSALQILISEMEECLTEGVGLDGDRYSVEFDVDALFRMDGMAMVKMLAEGIKGTIYKPNEARKRLNLSPVDGGDTIYSQQQNFSLAALDRRDRSADPFANGGNPVAEPEEEPADSEDDIEAQARAIGAMIEKEIQSAISA